MCSSFQTQTHTASLLVAALLVTLGCASTRQNSASSQEPTTPSPPFPNEELRQISRVPREQTQSLGGLNKPNGIEYRYRRWIPAETPGFVSLRRDSLDLVIADSVEDGWLALYQSPLRGIGPNQTYRAVLFSPSGERMWDVSLNQFFSRPDHLEIQDIRYADGSLYFNAACQTYSREANGKCSSLVKVNPIMEQVEWRTPYLTSNDIFILHGPYVISGYGFTAEPDFLYLIDRETGRIVSQVPLDTAHDYLEVKGNTLRVVTYESVYRFSLPARRDGGFKYENLTMPQQMRYTLHESACHPGQVADMLS